MKEQALAAALRYTDPTQRLNALREYLQVFILRSLHESEASRSVAFVGGTALRLLEDLPRFSEDLDFCRTSAAEYRPRVWLEKLKRDLHFAGFDSAVRWHDRKPVHAAWIRTSSLLAEAGLSGHPQQKLAIKVEIDTRPPAGAAVERAIVTRGVTFVVAHYDLPSLMAGKLHALLARRYRKGRDWFDLVWYRTRRPPVEPNLPLLQSALDQTEETARYRAREWRSILREQLTALDADQLIADVRPFLERPADAALLQRSNLAAVLGAGGEAAAR